jgi:hypothetical protein
MCLMGIKNTKLGCAFKNEDIGKKTIKNTEEYLCFYYKYLVSSSKTVIRTDLIPDTCDLILF